MGASPRCFEERKRPVIGTKIKWPRGREPMGCGGPCPSAPAGCSGVPVSPVTATTAGGQRGAHGGAQGSWAGGTGCPSLQDRCWGRERASNRRVGMTPLVSQRDTPRLDTDWLGGQYHSGNPTAQDGVAPAPEGHPRLAAGPAPHCHRDPQSLEWGWHPAHRGVRKEPHYGEHPQGLLWV